MLRAPLRAWSCPKLSRYWGEEAEFRMILQEWGVYPGRKPVGTLFPNWDDCSPWSKCKEGGVEGRELLEVIGLIIYNVGFKGARQEERLQSGWRGIMLASSLGLPPFGWIQTEKTASLDSWICKPLSSVSS